MRSLEELKELAKPALDHAELIAVARTASSNTEAKQRALVFTKEHGLDEQVAMSCRWVKMLRDRLDKEEFEKFVRDSTGKKEREMTSQTSLSKTEQYNLQLDALCNCANPDVSSRAKKVKELGFDPTRIEEIIGADLISKPGATVCAHCPACYDFVTPLSLKADGKRQDGGLWFFPMSERGFVLEIAMSENSFFMGARKEFLVDKIGMRADSAVFETHIFMGRVYGGGPVLVAQKVYIRKATPTISGESPYASVAYEIDSADPRVAKERLSFRLYPIYP